MCVPALMAALAQIGETDADVVATVYKCIELSDPKLVADALVKLQSPSVQSQVPTDMLKLIKSNIRDFYILTMWPLELPELKMKMETHFGADLSLDLRSQILNGYHHVYLGKFTKTKDRRRRRKGNTMEGWVPPHRRGEGEGEGARWRPEQKEKEEERASETPDAN